MKKLSLSASGVGLGAVLSQIQNAEERVIFTTPVDLSRLPEKKLQYHRARVTSYSVISTAFQTLLV